jgi:hypothetical protein
LAGDAQLDERRGNRWRTVGWGMAAALILLPLAAMQVTDEVNWGAEDFAAAAALVLAVGLAYELAVRTTRDWAYRAGVAVALAGAFVLLWANAAVGVIGSEDNPANLMFFAVPAVAILGALLARFRPHGMALAMAATAAAQVTVAAIALIAGLGFTGPITVFFTGLWLTSAWLFRKAATCRTQPS